jgi:LAO/AO transport system kinase
MTRNWDELAAGVHEGSDRALAKMITGVENRAPGWMDAMKSLQCRNTSTRVVGITGPAGSGKSTLTDRITALLVDKGHTVGIVAVDPSSPYSGGALLGDRLRMKDVSLMPGVFVRSMATRGALGGINRAAQDVVKILHAYGKDVIILETVGVGQDEIEVVRAADLVVVVCIPGQGDAIQAIKAGIMEIADLFVVNKADQTGADQVVADIEGMLDLCAASNGMKPPVLKTVATDRVGIEDLIGEMFRLLSSYSDDGERRKARIEADLVRLLEHEVFRLVKEKWDRDGAFLRAVEDVATSGRDPYSIVQEVLTPLESHFR